MSVVDALRDSGQVAEATWCCFFECVQRLVFASSSELGSGTLNLCSWLYRNQFQWLHTEHVQVTPQRHRRRDSRCRARCRRLGG